MRFRNRSQEVQLPDRDGDILAVPLTAGEAEILVRGLLEEDRVMRENFWSHNGSAWAVSHAAGLMHRAGYCAALGCTLVPVLVVNLDMYQNSLELMRQNRADPEITAAFAALLLRMSALSGAAAVHRWRVVFDGTGTRWAQEPSTGEDSGMPEIGR